MAVNGVEIKVGQVWRSRDGSIGTVCEVNQHPYSSLEYPWRVEFNYGGCISNVSMTDEGRYWADDARDAGDHPNDLMFLVSDPDVGKERRVAQTENPPLRRKDDYPPVPAGLPDLAASPADFAASVPGVFDEKTRASIADAGAKQLESCMQSVERSINAMYEAQRLAPAAAISAKPFVLGRLEETTDTAFIERMRQAAFRTARHLGLPCYPGSEEADRAVCSVLSSMGYSYLGGEFWKPPLGRAPAPAPAPEPQKVEMTLHVDSSMAVGGPTALDRQVGGSHYKNFRIQPVEFIHKNRIGFAEGCAIKYLCRWREKGGVADLEKAKHFIDLLIQMESQA